VIDIENDQVRSDSPELLWGIDPGHTSVDTITVTINPVNSR
jgi:hypothetical protein